MTEISTWGRIALTGGTDWATLGRKDKEGKKVINADRPDLETPHLIRSVLDIPFSRVITAHSGCHTVLLTPDHQPYLFGRNEHGQLGTRETVLEPAPLSDTAIFPDVPDELRHTRIVEAACGRSHTLLVTDSGELFSTGANTLGCCGRDGGSIDFWSFQRVLGPLAKETVVAASAGVSFSLALTKSGKVFAFGSPEKGQLGSGKTGEFIYAGRLSFQEEPTPILVKGLEGKNIVQIASGQQHSLALDDEGYVYTWGSSAYGRTGQGNQKDCLTATIIDQFTHSLRVNRATKITCGASCSMILDGQRMVYLCGKFKNTGDGSTGQPWMTPRTIQDLQSYKMKLIAAGGQTVFAIADEGKFNISIAIGQACITGELGLGVGAPKSATKPTRVTTLDDLDMLDISAGQNTTFFLLRPPNAEKLVATGSDNPAIPPATDQPAATAAPWDSGWGFNNALPTAAPAPDAKQNPEPEPLASTSYTKKDAWEALPRFPEVEAAELCVVCNEDKADVDQLECDKCEEPYHAACVDLKDIPEGEWFCSRCTTRVASKPSKPVAKTKKRKATDEDGYADESATKQGERSRKKSK